jgi:hypothetical protein
MTTMTQNKLLARRLILAGFGLLTVGLAVLLIAGTALPAWLVNLLIPGVPVLFFALTFTGLWLQVSHKKR